jgi:hypothetical protein
LYVDAVIVYWKARETEEKTVVKKQREIDTGKYKEICVCVCVRERERERERERRDETRRDRRGRKKTKLWWKRGKEKERGKYEHC